MTFRALLINHQESGSEIAVSNVDDADLVAKDAKGPEITIDVSYSAINYKDAMITVPGNRVARLNPLIPGIDVAGTIATSTTPSLAVGTPVIAHGYGIGVSRHGGFSQRASVPAGWVVTLPSYLDPKSAAGIGTAGFTAVASLVRLKEVGVTPDKGAVLVTGASGGVGSFAIGALHAEGYEVIALTRKPETEQYLRSLGASRVVDSSALNLESKRPLESEQFAGAIDCVGGNILAAICRSLAYGGAVAASGLTAGTTVPTTVYPFIIRGVALLGVDSVEMPMTKRQQVWNQMEPLVRSGAIEKICTKTIGLGDVASVCESILEGRHSGRTLVDPNI